MARQFVEESGLPLVNQTPHLVNPGDVTTIMEKPA
jgi:hypothetical protein